MARRVLRGFQPLYLCDLLGPLCNAAQALAIAGLLAILVFGAPAGI